MQIDQLELKKICIKYAQFDPHPIWQFVSVFTKKRVDKTLEDMKSGHENYDRTSLDGRGINTDVENALVNLINDNSQGRRKQFAKYLLMAAVPKNMISAQKAKEVAESLGIAGADFEQFLKQHFGEEPGVDIFDDLAGSNNTVQALQIQQQQDSTQQDLQIAASLKKSK